MSITYYNFIEIVAIQREKSPPIGVPVNSIRRVMHVDGQSVNKRLEGSNSGNELLKNNLRGSLVNN